MPLDRAQKLRTTGKNVTELPLTPEDFFVLSRVDGRATVGELIAASGLPAPAAQEILDKLVDLGAVEASVAGGGASARTGNGSRGTGNGASGAREKARARRAAMLRAQFGAASSSASAAGSASRSADAPRPSEASAPRAGQGGSDAATSQDRTDRAALAPKPDGTIRVEPVAAHDPRLDPSLDISVDEQRFLYATQDKLKTLSHFEFLGIQPTNDKKLIRSAYHLISRKFHPDRYYGKNVGPLMPLLQQLFKRAKGSFELLMKDDLREAYVQRHLETLRREEATRAAQAAAERQQSERAEAERLRAREEMEALEAQVAAKERAERDRERRERQQRRLMSARRAQKEERAGAYHHEGLALMQGGNPGKAANLFRMALDLDPDNEEYATLWKQCLREARVARATHSFSQANRLEEAGQYEDATKLYVEAAEANPTAEHLAEAAFAIREKDPNKARGFAMGALDAMSAAESAGSPLSRPKRGRVLICAAHAFLAAGQIHSARQQANAAQALLGDRPSVRALLKALKKA